MNADMMDMAIVCIGTLMLSLTIILIFSSHRNKRMKKRLARVKSRGREKSQQEMMKQSLRKVQMQQGDKRTLKEWLRYRLEISSVSLTVRQYAGYNLGVFAGVTGMLLAVGAAPLLAVLIGFVVGIGVPHMYLNLRIAGRKKKFLKLFPDAIDLIVRGLRAGLPAPKSMQSVVEEIPEPVSPVFREITEQVALGVPLEKAMADIARRLDMTEFDFFVTCIVLQRETGGNLTEILGNLSEVLRQRYAMKLKVKALSSEARASATIVGSLPFLVFAAVSVMSPDYMTPLYDDYRGNMALAGAALSLSTGVFTMIRLAKFEI